MTNTGHTLHPLLWRGRQARHTLPALATGYADLDDALPGHGWPQGALTEIIHAVGGCGELSLLLPVLAQLGAAQRWVVMIDPPWIPYPPALRGHGLALEKLLLVRTRSQRESLWACRQALCHIPAGAVLAWPQNLSFGEIRALQLAAKRRHNMAFVFRRDATADSPSPAALRLRLSTDHNDLLVRVLKCRGRRPPAAIRVKGLNRVRLIPPEQASHQRLIPPLVRSSGSSKRSRSSSDSSVVSLATSRMGRPSL